MNKVGNTMVGTLAWVEGYNFSERAPAFVVKWKSLLTDVHKCHWMRQVPTTLEYRPNSSSEYLYSSQTSHKLTALIF